MFEKGYSLSVSIIFNTAHYTTTRTTRNHPNHPPPPPPPPPETTRRGYLLIAASELGLNSPNETKTPLCGVYSLRRILPSSECMRG
jgi:hypothetical protein